MKTPRHAQFACDENHPGKSHNEWIRFMNANLTELAGEEDRSEDAAFIGKITLEHEQPETPGRDYCLFQHPDEPIQCHRPKGHNPPHSEFPYKIDFVDGLMQIAPSDAAKILDILADNEEYHTKRDEMNAAIHRSTDRVRYSPITSETIAQRERLSTLMREQGIPQ